MTVLLILAAWLLLSIPAALLIGAVIRNANEREHRA